MPYGNRPGSQSNKEHKSKSRKQAPITAVCVCETRHEQHRAQSRASTMQHHTQPSSALQRHEFAAGTYRLSTTADGPTVQATPPHRTVHLKVQTEREPAALQLGGG